MEIVSKDFHLLIRNNLLKMMRDCKLTDLTISCSSKIFNAHSLIIRATPSKLSKLLENLVGPPYYLEVSEVNADDFKILLEFLYVGEICESVNLQTYLSLIEKFDIPILFKACSDRIHDFVSTYVNYVQLNSIPIEEMKSCMKFALNCKSLDIRKIMLDITSYCPFNIAEYEYLSYISPEEFGSLIESGSLLMNDINFIYFGKLYFSKCCELIEKYRNLNQCDEQTSKLLYNSLNILKTNVLNPKHPYPLLAPRYVTLLKDMPFGNHRTYENNYKLVGNTSFSTCSKYPPTSWKIVGVTAYVAKNWSDIRPLAGLDVHYQNIWSGKIKSFLWKRGKNKSKYTVHSVTLDPGDVIEGIHIRHGYLIDQMVLITQSGKRLGPLGLSEGGSLFSVSIHNKETDHHSPNMSFDSEEEHVDAELGCQVGSQRSFYSEEKVALQGFCFKEIESQNTYFWNKVYFIFASWTDDVINHLPYFNHHGLEQKHFSM